MTEYNYICLEKKIIHERRDDWFNWTRKDIYLFRRENNGLNNNNNKEVLLLLLLMVINAWDFGNYWGKILWIKMYVYFGDFGSINNVGMLNWKEEEKGEGSLCSSLR